MRNKKLFVSLSLAAVGVAALVAVGTAANPHFAFANAAECTHEGKVNHYDAVEPTCEKAGNIEFWVCCDCHNSYKDEGLTQLIENTSETVGLNFVETDGRYLAPKHDLGEVNVTREPTVAAEGEATQECGKCEHVVNYAILKLANNLKIVGNVFSWDEVENAEAYEVYLKETKLATVETTSYTLTTAALVDISTYSPVVLTVRAITTAEGYYAHGNAACGIVPILGEELHTNNPKFDNFTPVDLRFNRTAGWDFYPYGNWSDMNGDVGGHYYIQTQADGNTCLKVPAVVWYPGNTTVKKDLSGNTALPGTYEISFDLMASEQALTLNNGNGGYGALHAYMWADAEGFAHAIPATFNVSSVVKDIANATTWSNVRARYTVPEGTAATFNQFNIIYWPEGNIGEDNYILIDNIEIYKVVEGVAVEDNIDTIMGGDLEMFTMPFAGTVYHGNILVEPSSRGSSIVHDNDNQYLKLVSGDHHPTSDITIHSNGAINQAGMYYLTVDVKIGEDADLYTPLRVKAWSYFNGGVNALVDDVQLRPVEEEPSKDEFVTYGAIIISKGAANDWANLFFMAELHNDINRSMDNCLFLDNISIVPVSV